MRIVNGELRINPRNRAFWDDPTSLALYQNQSGFWSTQDSSHIFFHEAGHDALVNEIHQLGASTSIGRSFPKILNRELAQSNHDDIWSKPRWEKELSPALARILLNEVSRHALVSPAEFIAEVFAGMMAERTYSNDVMQKYKEYRGPEV